MKASISLEHVIMALICMVVAVVVIMVFQKPAEAAYTYGSVVISSARTEACKLDFEKQLGYKQKKYKDSDADGYPDYCDFCLGGDDSYDNDNDGIADACDSDKDNPPKKGDKIADICKQVSGTFKEGGNPHCQLPNYKP